MDTKNLTIFFSDMVSFTKTSSNFSREQILQLIEAQEKIISLTIIEFKGKVIKTIGDAYLAVFESSTNALLCAIKIQDQIAAYNKNSPKNDRFNVRIALNCGDVTIKDNDVFGTPVNVASRVQSLAKPGEIYLTEAVYLAINRNEIPFSRVGKKSLKGVSDKIELYKVDLIQGFYLKRSYFLAACTIVCFLVIVIVFLSAQILAFSGFGLVK